MSFLMKPVKKSAYIDSDEKEAVRNLKPGLHG